MADDLSLIHISHFGEGEGGRQLSLFEQEENGAQHERQKSLEQAVDGIRGKYGHGSISYAQILKNDLGIAPDDLRNQKEK